MYGPNWSTKHTAEWLKTVRDYLGPTIGETRVDRITSADVMAVLLPIWNEKPETARRRASVKGINEDGIGTCDPDDPRRSVPEGAGRRYGFPRSGEGSSAAPDPDPPRVLVAIHTEEVADNFSSTRPGAVVLNVPVMTMPAQPSNAREIAGIERAILDGNTRVLEDYGGLQAALDRIVALKKIPPAAGPVVDRRLYGLAVAAVARKWILSVVKGRSVSIGKRTSDNGVDVRGKRFSTCTAAFPYVTGSLAVPPPPPQLACRSGDIGGGRERPPLDPLDQHRGVSACARRCSPPRGGRSRPKYPSGKARILTCDRPRVSRNRGQPICCAINTDRGPLRWFRWLRQTGTPDRSG